MGGKDRRAGGRCCTPIIKSSHEKIKKLKAKTAPREQLKISTDCLQGSWHKSINLFARLPSDAHDDWTAGSGRRVERGKGSRYSGTRGQLVILPTGATNFTFALQLRLVLVPGYSH